MEPLDDDGWFEGVVVFGTETGIDGTFGGTGCGKDADAESLVLTQRPLGITHHQRRIGDRNDLINNKVET